MMSALNIELSSNFITTGQGNLILSSSFPCWHEKVKQIWDVSPLTLRIGRCVLNAVGFSYAKGGLYSPTTTDVETILSSVHGNLQDEVSLWDLAKKLITTPSKISLNFPQFIAHTAETVCKVFTKACGFAIDVHFEPHPEIPLTLPSHEALRPFYELLKHPVSAYKDYQTRFPHGTCRLITMEHVHFIASSFFGNMSLLKSVAESDPGVITIKDLNEDTQLLIHRHEDGIDLYSIFAQYSWKGSFKGICLGLKIKERLIPVGIATSEEPRESKKEILFRKHEHIAPLITPLHLHWSYESKHHLIHGWASKGTLNDILKTPLSTAEKDMLALQLLEKMHIFHQHAIHKDLNDTNLVINKTAKGMKLYINDVGSSSLKDDAAGFLEVTTNSYNLAPELIAECAELHGYYWDSLIEHPISPEKWELSERFSVGSLIFRIYMGKSPYMAIQNAQLINAAFPLANLEFRDIYSNPPRCYALERYIHGTPLEIELAECYLAAFRKADMAIALLQNPLINKGRVDLKTITSGWTIPDAIENELYQRAMKNIDLRLQIETHILDKARHREIYKQAYKKMQQAYSIALYSDLAKLIATTPGSIPDLFSHLAGHLNGRIGAIFPLLEKDPAKRPPLNEIFDMLRARTV